MVTARLNAHGIELRHGAIMVWTVLMLVVVFAFVAFALDIGYLVSTKSDLQNSADAAARAAARALPDGENAVAQSAKLFAEKNQVNHKQLVFEPREDLEIGIWDSTSRTFDPLSNGQIDEANATRVTAKLNETRGTGVRLLFARIIGIKKTTLEASAIAAIERGIRGFSDPGFKRFHPVLPFTVDADSWIHLKNGVGTDQFRWNDELGIVERGSDGIPELNVFPEGNLAPGNRGYLNIGSRGGRNSTLNRQIRRGINTDDLAFHGGTLDLGSESSLILGGRPGVRASQQDAFHSIVGETRVIPLFAQVSGTGKNTQYKIVGWVGARVMYVNFGGSPKQVLLQPANVWIKDGVVKTTEPSETSLDVFVKPKLVE